MCSVALTNDSHCPIANTPSKPASFKPRGRRLVKQNSARCESVSQLTSIVIIFNGKSGNFRGWLDFSLSRLTSHDFFHAFLSLRNKSGGNKLNTSVWRHSPPLMTCRFIENCCWFKNCGLRVRGAEVTSQIDLQQAQAQFCLKNVKFSVSTYPTVIITCKTAIPSHHF